MNNCALHYDELVPVEIEQHDRCCSNVGCHVMNDSALHYNEIEHHTYLDALLSSLSTFPPSEMQSLAVTCPWAVQLTINGAIALERQDVKDDRTCTIN